MKSLEKFLLVLGLQLLAVSAFGQQVTIESLRHWLASDHSRLVFDLSAPVSHQVFLLANPERLVIDFTDARLLEELALPSNDPVFARIRSAPRNHDDLRVVVDLKKKGTVKYFTLAPAKMRGYRLVVDLYPGASGSTPALIQASRAPEPRKTAATSAIRKRDVIIAVDAGHGGEDPGARGPHGTHEKDVTFAIANKLTAMINHTAGMKAVMVRKGDYYIGLRQRMKIARTAKADLFISIHADAFRQSDVKGASVFTLSNRGATSEAARWLANHENASDLVGGVSLDDKDDVLASVLLDLSQTATQEASVDVAGKVLNHLKRIGPLHQQSVQKAGFMVLKSPDVPSILVETAFISNPTEESKLTSRRYQTRMARAIFSGVDSYFRQHAPAATRIAAENRQKHVITRGETLSGIAQQYGVSMSKIKSLNAITGNEIRIGQVLDIPTDG